MERIIVETWSEMEGNLKFLGVSLIYLREKDDINKEVILDISYMGKKRGTCVMNIFENKNKANMKDVSNAPKRMIKATVIEAVTL